MQQNPRQGPPLAVFASLPPLQADRGIFFYAGTYGFDPFFGDGSLCVTPPLLRIPSTLQTDGNGSASLALDFTMPPFAFRTFTLSS